MVNVASRAKSYSMNASYDYIYPSSALRVACDYVGVAPPPSQDISYLSFNPLSLFTLPSFNFPKGLLEQNYTSNEGAWRGWKGAELFKNPYINPSIIEDDAWWKEACPSGGNTAVCWGKQLLCQLLRSKSLTTRSRTGGKEIFADDDEALYHTLGRVSQAVPDHQRSFTDKLFRW